MANVEEFKTILINSDDFKIGDSTFKTETNKIAQDIKELDNKITINSSNINFLYENTTNTTNTTNDDSRLTALEAKDLSHDQSLTTLEAKDLEHDGRLTAAEATDLSHGGRLTTLEATDLSHGGRLTTLETKDLTHDDSLTALGVKDISHDQSLAAIKSYINSYITGYRLKYSIDGPQGARFGEVISLTKDGSAIAVGGPYYPDGGTQNDGIVRVYQIDMTLTTPHVGDDPYTKQIGGDLTYDSTPDTEFYGRSVSLAHVPNTNKYRLIIGSTAVNTNNGEIFIYEYNGSTWIPQNFAAGALTQGDAASQSPSFGEVTAMSSDGSTAAAASSYQGTNPLIRVYRYSDSASPPVWETIGTFGGVKGDGSSLTLSSNGDLLAIGQPNWAGLTGTDAGSVNGQVQVWKYSGTGTQWNPKGQIIVGNNPGDDFGHTQQISENGNTLVISASPGNTDLQTGYVKVYTYDETGAQWEEKSPIIYGSIRHYFGRALSINQAHNIIAIGTPNDNGGVGKVDIVNLDLNTNTGVLGTATYSQTLHGPPQGTPHDMFGISIGLDNTGNILAISASNVGDAAGGRVYIYEKISALS